MSNSTHEHTARSSRGTSCPHGPLQVNVGEPWPPLETKDVYWPDTNGASIEFKEAVSHMGISRTLAVRFRVKTRVFVLALLAMIFFYAAYKGDRGLITKVLGVVGTFSQTHSASTAPP